MSSESNTSKENVTAEQRGERLGQVSEQWLSTLDKKPEKASLAFKAEGDGFGMVATRVQSGNHAYVVDEPAPLGGDDLGANPVETALGSLIACQTVTYRVWAHNMGIALDDINIQAEGDLDVRGFFGLDDNVRPGYSGVRLTVTLSGPESRERYQELHDAVDKHCPVHDIFSNPTPVTTDLVVD
jgi:uncharacterized OsmC-like protein